MAVTRSLDLFAKERPVVDRETERGAYAGAEYPRPRRNLLLRERPPRNTARRYVVAKALAELPLDCFFAALHGYALDRATPGGLRCRPQQVLPLCAAAAARAGTFHWIRPDSSFAKKSMFRNAI